MKTYHPDKNKGHKLSQLKFQKINQAWEVLKNPEKRKLFDEQLKEQRALKARRAPLLSEREVVPVVQPEKAREKAIDLEIPLKLSIEELCQACSKTIKYLKPVQNKKIKTSFPVQIPWGLKPMSRLRFKGEGGAEGKKEFGDLYVKIQFRPHRLFKLTQEWEDIVLEYPVSFISAMEDLKLQIPSPYGFLALNLKPPIKDKQLFKIKGHGLPKNPPEAKGDLFVQMRIDYPSDKSLNIKEEMKGLSFEQKKLYVKKFKNKEFIYPRMLKFKKNLEEWRLKYNETT